MARGKYIVIEGQDGTGKTTQADLLQAYLEAQGITVLHTKEPGGLPVGEAIRSVLLNGTLPRKPMTNLLLFTANRHELWESVINPALEEGTWVICTRNYWSTIAYQGSGEGMDTDTIHRVTAEFTAPEYISPDIAVILSFSDTSVRLKRIAERGAISNPDTFESKETGFQQRVQEAYPTIAEEFGVRVIDANQSVSDIQKTIQAVVDAMR